MAYSRRGGAGDWAESGIGSPEGGSVRTGLGAPFPSFSSLPDHPPPGGAALVAVAASGSRARGVRDGQGSLEGLPGGCSPFPGERDEPVRTRMNAQP